MAHSNVPGAPCWIELFTADTEAAQRFYGELFGWTAEVAGPDYGGYITFLHRGAPIAGCMHNDRSAGAPSSWSVYLESNSAADTAAMAKANGGVVLMDAMPVHEMGHMAFVTDPGGATVGIWQGLAHPGFSALGEVGAPSWFELQTRDYHRALPFYENVFGWVTHTVSDALDFRYTTLGRDDDALAGVMDASELPGDAPSAWWSYIEVDDTDAATARAVELGGIQVSAPEDSPYGRVAQLADPSGVMFKIRSSDRSTS